MEWEPTPDELAGIVDLFGGLTREELGRAVAELAFKRGEEADPEAYDPYIRRGVQMYALLAVDHDAGRLLVPGPVAFPALPDGAADLPHILEIPSRSIPPALRADRVRARLAAEAERAVDRNDEDRAATLLEVTYDAESWASVEVDAIRDRLRTVL